MAVQCPWRGLVHGALTHRTCVRVLGLRNTAWGAPSTAPAWGMQCGVGTSLSRPVSRGLSRSDGRSCPLRLGTGQALPTRRAALNGTGWGQRLSVVFDNIFVGVPGIPIRKSNMSKTPLDAEFLQLGALLASLLSLPESSKARMFHSARTPHDAAVPRRC